MLNILNLEKTYANYNKIRIFPRNKEIDTEEQLITIFKDLKQEYSKFNNQKFKITTEEGKTVKTFKHFLQIATGGDYRYDPERNTGVLLKGSGDIGGLVVENALVEYDLSAVYNLTIYWDSYRDGSCDSCRKYGFEQITENEKEWACTANVKQREEVCKKYDPFKKRDSRGKGAARPLDKIIEEVSLN